jgi:CRP/FNR family transcriptional regulator, cyclic AMP receptor protein
MDTLTEQSLTAGWLARAEPPLRKALLEAGHIRHFGDGATIYTFDQDQDCLWGVVSGLVRISIALNEQEPKLAHCGGPGFWFGEVPVISGRNRAVQATASGETRLCAIDRADIAALAHRTPETWRLVATLSVLNQLTAIGAGEDLMIRDPLKRVVAVLLRLSGHRNGFQGAAPIPAIPVTQAELAEASTLSRSSATAILKDLAQRGMIRTDYRSLLILDPAALEHLLAE